MDGGNLIENSYSLNHNDEHDKARRKRRSKNDPEGRENKCEICGKSYLSRPAMTQHIKTKHADKISEFKRGRGRPKKSEMGENHSTIITKDTYYKAFFKHIKRAKNDNEDGFDYRTLLRDNLVYLKQKYPDLLFEGITDVAKDHPLCHVSIDESIESKKVVYDEVVLRYLVYIAQSVNKDYFDFVCRFSILFRESFNFLKKKEHKSEEPYIEYTTRNCAEEAPDKFNEFITDFMESKGIYELESNELIEIIQHYGYWLFENGYSTLMLSLLSN